MGYKLDFRVIIKHHFKTIVNDNNNKADLRDWFFFLYIPILVAGLLSWQEIFLSENYINAVISGFSIYVGMALNLIVLVFGMVQRNKISAFRIEFAKDLVANITFSILLSILSIILALLTQIPFKSLTFLKVYRYGTNFVAYFSITEMILAVLLLVRNMYFQLLDQISANKK